MPLTVGLNAWMSSPQATTSDEHHPSAVEDGTPGHPAKRLAQQAADLARESKQKLVARSKHTIERWSSQLARRNLAILVARGNIAETLSDIPEQMHRVARQTALVIEFVDDFRAARYRGMPWWAVAVAVTAMAYTVNPVDVIPNAIPLVGVVDDLAVVAVATRVLRKQLVMYCEFKGYPVKDYF
jgi:uncharacterized membrane protein YkvA (DUF1232 family)